MAEERETGKAGIGREHALLFAYLKSMEHGEGDIASVLGR